jgi:hypothetical protein
MIGRPVQRQPGMLCRSCVIMPFRITLPSISRAKAGLDGRTCGCCRCGSLRLLRAPASPARRHEVAEGIHAMVLEGVLLLAVRKKGRMRSSLRSRLKSHVHS